MRLLASPADGSGRWAEEMPMDRIKEHGAHANALPVKGGEKSSWHNGAVEDHQVSLLSVI